MKDVLRMLESREISSRELTSAYRARITERNPELNAYVETFADAEAQADAADEIRARGDAHPLTGVPLAVKDNIAIEGRKLSCASKILEGYTASYDAGVIAQLKQHSPVFLGRTNMDEFAMGSSSEFSAYGPVRNPHDTERVPGGSSGGSAAAVAAGMAPAALGSDTGGSLRQPASFCGVVGLKPTYGTVSRSGLVAMASSLDQIGSLTRTVADARTLFESISAHDVRDSTSVPKENRTPRMRAGAGKGKSRIGVPGKILDEGGALSGDVRENFNQSLARMQKAGYELVDVDLPYARSALAAYYIIMPAEASANLARFDGVRYGLHRDGENVIDDYLKTRAAGFGPEVRSRILLGTYVLSAGYFDAYYNNAIAVRRATQEELARAFEDVDYIAFPTAPTPAFKIGEKADDPLAMYFSDIFTVPANIAGTPALSLPSGTLARDGNDLPVGFQLLAPHFAELSLFEAGEDFEKSIELL